MTGYIFIVRNADIFIKSCKSNISERQKSAFLKYRHMVVGHFVGAEALAAVGYAYTLMTFITSIIIGLCMGSNAVFSMAYGAENELKNNWCLTQ